MSSLEQRKQFFDTFGYLVLPGLLQEEISRITQEFEAVFQDRHVTHDTGKRSCIVPFIDQRERLCSLLDETKILQEVKNLLGEDFNYLGSDGNYYTGDTPWHSDGLHYVGKYLKVAFYLDPVNRDTGALRVIPGSHRVSEGQPQWAARQAIKSVELWGIEQRDVPALSLDSQPGDVVIFNHNLMHASFGGSTRRRMFTMNLGGHCESAQEIQDLEDYIGSIARFWVDRFYGPVMANTASSERMRHLQQVMEHQSHLPALAARARETMAEPARG